MFPFGLVEHEADHVGPWPRGQCKRRDDARVCVRSLKHGPFLMRRPLAQRSCNPLPFSLKPFPQVRLLRKPAGKLKSVGMLKFVFQKRCAKAGDLGAGPERDRVPPGWPCARSLAGIIAFRPADGGSHVFVQEYKTQALRYRSSP